MLQLFRSTSTSNIIPTASRLTSIQNHLTPTTMTEKIVLPSEGAHGEQDGTATATCYCGAVQIEVPTEGEGLVDTFICHCTDCRKITARYIQIPIITPQTS